MTIDLPDLAISVRQPWAWAIIHAGKDVENRSFASLRFMRLSGIRALAIHAAQGMTRDEYDDAHDFMASLGVVCPSAAKLTRGAIIGSVTVDGVTSKSTSRWFFGPGAIRMSAPTPIEPIHCAGALGLFRWRDMRLIDPPVAARWMTPDVKPARKPGLAKSTKPVPLFDVLDDQS